MLRKLNTYFFGRCLLQWFLGNYRVHGQYGFVVVICKVFVYRNLPTSKPLSGLFPTYNNFTDQNRMHLLRVINKSVPVSCAFLFVHIAVVYRHLLPAATKLGQGNIYRPKRSFGQGNVFTGVCDSVHGGGVWSRGVSPIFGGCLQFFGGEGSPIFWGSPIF